VSPDLGVGRVDQLQPDRLAVCCLFSGISRKPPFTPTDGMPVFTDHPSSQFRGMSAFGPAPHGLPNLPFRFSECARGHDMAKQAPAPPFHDRPTRQETVVGGRKPERPHGRFPRRSNAAGDLRHRSIQSQPVRIHLRGCLLIAEPVVSTLGRPKRTKASNPSRRVNSPILDVDMNPLLTGIDDRCNL
jgi:hypothetical protein